jgi:hypothetical protein
MVSMKPAGRRKRELFFGMISGGTMSYRIAARHGRSTPGVGSHDRGQSPLGFDACLRDQDEGALPSGRAHLDANSKTILVSLATVVPDATGMARYTITRMPLTGTGDLTRRFMHSSRATAALAAPRVSRR